MAAKVNIDVDLSQIEAKFSDSELRAKQSAFAHRVEFDIRKYVPVDEGTLRNSTGNSSFETGQIVWDTEYASYVYNMDDVLHVKNPNAKPHWAEYAKQEKLEDWRQYAATLIAGGGVTINT